MGELNMDIKAMLEFEGDGKSGMTGHRMSGVVTEAGMGQGSGNAGIPRATNRNNAPTR